MYIAKTAEVDSIHIRVMHESGDKAQFLPECLFIRCLVIFELYYVM